MTAKPTYKAHNARYEIDRCEPQVRAVREGKIEFHALTKGHYPGTNVPANVLQRLNSIGFWNAGSAQDWSVREHAPDQSSPARTPPLPRADRDASLH